MTDRCVCKTSFAISAKPQAVEVGGELDAVGAPTGGLVTSVNQWFENAEITTVPNQAVDVIDEDYVSGNDEALAPVVDLLGEYVSDSEPVLADSSQFVATGEYDLRPLGEDASDLGFGILDLGFDGEPLADILDESALSVL